MIYIWPKTSLFFQFFKIAGTHKLKNLLCNIQRYHPSESPTRPERYLLSSQGQPRQEHFDGVLSIFDLVAAHSPERNCSIKSNKFSMIVQDHMRIMDYDYIVEWSLLSGLSSYKHNVSSHITHTKPLLFHSYRWSMVLGSSLICF